MEWWNGKRKKEFEKKTNTNTNIILNVHVSNESNESSYNFHSILFSFVHFDGDLFNGFAYEKLFSINSMGHAPNRRF